MSPVEIVKCLPTDMMLKRFHSNGFLYLERHKANEMQRIGKVRIMGQEAKINTIENQLAIPLSGIRVPVVIAYAPQQKIGYAYNREMAYIDDWVVFIDYDVMLLNPHWYDICLNAIQKVGHDAGWITCYTNRIGNQNQALSIDNINSHDIKYHQLIAKKMYDTKRGKILDLTSKPGELSGMFILTNKKAWKVVGGFKEEGFYGIDNDYSRKLKAAGFHLYLMQDLYVYHSYFRFVMKDGSEVW
jgi:glycosyltransferase involved in cell wall biosynthesis